MAELSQNLKAAPQEVDEIIILDLISREVKLCYQLRDAKSGYHDMQVWWAIPAVSEIGRIKARNDGFEGVVSLLIGHGTAPILKILVIRSPTIKPVIRFPVPPERYDPCGVSKICFNSVSAKKLTGGIARSAGAFVMDQAVAL